MRPSREPAGNNQQTYFVTFTTAQRTPLFRHERWLLLLLNILERHKAEYLLHDFVVTEDFVYMLLTPAGTLERTAQLIKGGFSYQAKRQLEWSGEVWQKGFSDHLIRDRGDYQQHVQYLQKILESLREILRTQRGRHAGSSSMELAPIPQWLKPLEPTKDGAAEAAPFQDPLNDESGVQASL